MDFAGFADLLQEVVVGLCGDRVVETHEQASAVLDALLRRPGAERREIAAVFGISLEQLERCRHVSHRDPEDNPLEEVYDGLCHADAVFTWNIILQRINEAAHWQEEFRDLCQAEESSAEEEDVTDSKMPDAFAAATGAATPLAGAASARHEVRADTRDKAQGLLARHLDAPEYLRQQLARRLEAEIFEHFPEDKDYRHTARTIAANFRRNTMLAAGYTGGRIPPQWIVLADTEALASRLQKLQRRALRSECLKEAKTSDEGADLRKRAADAGRGAGLAPPAQMDDPYA